MKRWFALLMLALVLLALSACGGGDDSDDDSAGTSGGTTEPTATATATATETATPEATTEPEPDESGAFAEALARLQGGSYRVSYEFTTSAAGQDFNGSLTWVRAEDGRARFETTATQAGHTVTIIVIADAEGSELLCMDLAGSGTCFDPETSPVGGSMPNPAELILEGITDETRMPGVTHSGSETILGIDTECYTYSGPDGDSEACISDEGFMLRAEWSGGGQSARLEATEFSDDVSDEDFEAPYPITG